VGVNIVLNSTSNDFVIEALSVATNKQDINKFGSQDTGSKFIHYSIEQIREEQLKEFGDTFDILLHQKETKSTRKIFQNYKILNNCLLGYKDKNDFKILLTVKSCICIMACIHFNSHSSLDRLLSQFSKHFFIQQKTFYAKLVIASCKTCLMISVPLKKDFVSGHVNRYSRPLECVAIDHFHMRDVGFGNKRTHLVLNIVCVFSQYCLAEIAITENAKETKRILEQLLITFPQIRYILSDNAPNFISKEIASFVKQHNVTHVFTSAYNSKSNSICESSNKLLRNAIHRLQISNDEQNWTKVFGEAKLVVNSLIRSYAKGSDQAFQASAVEVVYGVKSEVVVDKLARMSRKPIKTIFQDRALLQNQLLTYFKTLKDDLQENDDKLENVITTGSLVLLRQMPPDKLSSFNYQKNVYRVLQRTKRAIDVVNLYGSKKISTVHVKFAKLIQVQELLKLLTAEIREKFGSYYAN
jgi:transposase InsO family protein